MGFAGCLLPDSPCENCNCCFIAASTSVHFFSSSASSSHPPPFQVILHLLPFFFCFVLFLSPPWHLRADCPVPCARTQRRRKLPPCVPPSLPSRSIVLLINPRTATLVPERPTTPLDPQANVRKFGVTRTHTSRVKNKAKEQRGLIACTRRTIVFSLPPHKAGRKPSDTESAGACPSRCLHLGRRRTHASTEGLAVPPLNELS